AFVNTGSSSEYGLKGHPPSEDDALTPNSRYAVGKAAATLYCTQAAVAADAPITTLRLYSVYGPWEDQRRFVAQLVAQGLAGRLQPPPRRAGLAPGGGPGGRHREDSGLAPSQPGAALPLPGAEHGLSQLVLGQAEEALQVGLAAGDGGRHGGNRAADHPAAKAS